MFTNADIHFENLIFENWNETQHFKTWTWIKLKIATHDFKNQWEVGDCKNYDDDSVDDGEFECSSNLPGGSWEVGDREGEEVDGEACRAAGGDGGDDHGDHDDGGDDL